MKQKEKQYYKVDILLPYIKNINENEANIDKLSERLFHLENKMRVVKEVSAPNADLSLNEQYQKLVEKRIRLLERIEEEKNNIFKALNTMLSSFKSIKIETEEEVDEIYNCINFINKRVGIEANKGAILSNILAIKVEGNNKKRLFNGLENMIEKDKKILTGYLLQKEAKEVRTLKYNNNENGFIEFYKNSLYNKAKFGHHYNTVKIINNDKGYLERFFDIVGKDFKKLNLKELSKEDVAFMKKQYQIYRVEHKAKAKLASKALKCTAAVPSTIGNVIFGTGYGIGKGIGFIKNVVIVSGLLLASPFILTGKGIKKFSNYITKNKTYKEDERHVYENVNRTLKKNKVKFKTLDDVKAKVENINDNQFLNLNGTITKKDKTKEEYSIGYVLKEGEYKSFRNLLSEGGEVDEKDEDCFTIGENRDEPDYIRFMRRLSEFSDDDAITLDIGKETEEEKE